MNSWIRSCSSLSPLFTKILVVLLAVAPFWSIYLGHFALARPGKQGTGFIQYDQPHYVAIGREIFERGNGVAYPNPYDTQAHPPILYFHWLFWILGICVSFLKLDPGYSYVGIGAIGSLAMAWLTHSLVEHIVPEKRLTPPCYFLVMWGGGFLVLGGAISALLQGEPLRGRPTLSIRSPGWFLVLKLGSKYDVSDRGNLSCPCCGFVARYCDKASASDTLAGRGLGGDASL